MVHASAWLCRSRYSYQPANGPGLPFPIGLPSTTSLHSAPYGDRTDSCVSPKLYGVSQFPSLCAYCPLAWNSPSFVFPLTVVFPFFPRYCCQSYGFWLRKFKRPPVAPRAVLFPFSQTRGIQGCALARLLSTWAPQPLTEPLLGHLSTALRTA